jgi:hypothetical protein
MRDVPSSPSDHPPAEPPTNGRHLGFLEIDTGQSKRWRGLVGWVLLVVLVASLLVALFIQFTGSMRLAIVLVAFMMTYMGVMGWLASRKADRG